MYCLEIIKLSLVSHTERQIYDITHVESNFKKQYKWTYLQNRKTYKYWKQTYGYQRGNVAGRDKSGAWDEHTHATI